MFHRKDLVHVYQTILYSKCKKKKISYIYQFLGDKTKNVSFICIFFFKLLPKFSDFINSGDCIGKIRCRTFRSQDNTVTRFGLFRLQVLRQLGYKSEITLRPWTIRFHCKKKHCSRQFLNAVEHEPVPTTPFKLLFKINQV